MNQNPRQRRKAKNQASILDIAAHLIVTKGFDNVSLRDIAKEADYSPAGLYKLFDNKAAIIKAVLTRQNQLLLDQLEAIQIDNSPKQRLIEICMEYIRFTLDNPVFLILLNNLPSGRSSNQQPIPSNSPYTVLYLAVTNWVKSENLKLNKKFNIEELSYTLWSQIHGMATLRLSQLKDYKADFESINRLSIEIYLHGLENWS